MLNCKFTNYFSEIGKFFKENDAMMHCFEFLDIIAWGLLAPKPLGVFMYRLLSLNHLEIVHFY